MSDGHVAVPAHHTTHCSAALKHLGSSGSTMNSFGLGCSKTPCHHHLAVLLRRAFLPTRNQGNAQDPSACSTAIMKMGEGENGVALHCFNITSFFPSPPHCAQALVVPRAPLCEPHHIEICALVVVLKPGGVSSWWCLRQLDRLT